jgi:hypothetical protein
MGTIVQLGAPTEAASPSSPAPESSDIVHLFTKLSLSGSEPRPNARRRQPWTAAEDEALQDGFAKHSEKYDIWASIKQDEHYQESLGRRSNQDLSKRFKRINRPTREPAPSALQPPSASPAKRSWTEEETNALLDGIALYGWGHWKLILAHPDLGPQLTRRNNLQLKDRAVTLRNAAARKSIGQVAHPRLATPLGAAFERAGVAVAPDSPESACSAPHAAPPRNTRPQEGNEEGSGREDSLWEGIEQEGSGHKGSPQGGVPHEDSGLQASEGKMTPSALGVDLARLPMQKRYLGFIDDLIRQAEVQRMSREAVRTWLQRHPDECPVPSHELHLYAIDHIIPHKLGGHDHPCNYMLLETSPNTSFKHYFDRNKERVLGKKIWRIVNGFAGFCRDNAQVDYSKFNIVNYLRQ